MDVKATFNKFIKDSKRVLKVAKKPDKEEYWSLAKITVLGIIVIGVIGFIITMIASVIGL